MSNKPKEIWSSLYPFESHWFELDGGLRYHYLDERRGQGKRDSDREVILMVHGNPTWSFYWRNLITSLRDRYRVIAVDHIGCGLSDKPTEEQYPFTLARRISDLSALIESLDLQRITLVAHDWGGAIGMGAACRHEKRFQRFVLMNTGAFRFNVCPLRIALCRLPLIGRLSVQGLNLFARAATKMAVAPGHRLPNEVRAGLLAPYKTWADRLAIYKFVQDIPMNEKHQSYGTLLAIEENLRLFRNHPICLIWGMLDWCFTSDYIKRFLQFYPEAEVHRFSDAGHYVVEEAAERIVPIIEEFFSKNVIG
ncbi:MAG: alpha/beta fold hydrolase [Planctomycetaceae bacterium]|nr:alpha/beta fold hydrolase [Planctomycetaceae bacterium]